MSFLVKVCEPHLKEFVCLGLVGLFVCLKKQIQMPGIHC